MPRPFTPSPAFPAARAHMAALNAATAVASATLNAIPGVGTGAMGLTPDSVKFSPAYREALASYNRLSGIARDYAGFYTRTFKRELRADRDARRAGGAL